MLTMFVFARVFVLMCVCYAGYLSHLTLISIAFSFDLYLAGYRNQVNIDLSSVVIGQQKEKFKDFPEMSCELCSVCV
jgi:hypothetical protein